MGRRRAFFAVARFMVARINYNVSLPACLIALGTHGQIPFDPLNTFQIAVPGPPVKGELKALSHLLVAGSRRVSCMVRSWPTVSASACLTTPA